MNIAKKTPTKDKGSRTFEFIVAAGVGFAAIKIMQLIVNILQFMEDRTLTNQLFLSRIDLSKSAVELPLAAVIIIALFYLLIWGFVVYGLIQLNKISKQLNKGKVFDSNTARLFRSAGKSFLYFGFGTLLIDFIVLLINLTSNRLIDLLSTEIMIFIIFGYMMIFLSDVFKTGFSISEENDLTI